MQNITLEESKFMERMYVLNKSSLRSDILLLRDGKELID